jgi:hypothetical protein
MAAELLTFGIVVGLGGVLARIWWVYLHETHGGYYGRH